MKNPLLSLGLAAGLLSCDTDTSFPPQPYLCRRKKRKAWPLPPADPPKDNSARFHYGRKIVRPFRNHHGRCGQDRRRSAYYYTADLAFDQ